MKLSFRNTLSAIAIVLLLATSAHGESISVVGFNVGSGEDTSPVKVAGDVAKIPESTLWGLAGIEGPKALNIMRQSIGPGYRAILGRSGSDQSGSKDNIAIVYHSASLRLMEWWEMVKCRGSRKPLVAKFQVKDGDAEFLFVVNRLERGNVSIRNEQAKYLHYWGLRQSLPVVAAGDYSFDWKIKKKKGNAAFDLFTKGGVYKWVQPECVGFGICPKTGTQCNSIYSGIQDFIFLTGPAKKWATVESNVLFMNDKGYCERSKKGHADHRPVRAVLFIQ